MVRRGLSALCRSAVTPLPPPQVLHIGAQVARALSYLHPTVMHRGEWGSWEGYDVRHGSGKWMTRSTRNAPASRHMARPTATTPSRFLSSVLSPQTSSPPTCSSPTPTATHQQPSWWWVGGWKGAWMFRARRAVQAILCNMCCSVVHCCNSRSTRLPAMTWQDRGAVNTRTGQCKHAATHRHPRSQCMLGVRHAAYGRPTAFL